MSDFKKYRKELLKENLSTLQDLEKLVLPLIRKATKITVKKASHPPQNSQQISHFGGQPYFEKGAKWPINENKQPLEFIFQIFNQDGLVLPQNIKLIQFFYDFEEMPWETEDDGWKVITYETLNTANVIPIEKPEELERSKYCELNFSEVQSLPDWEGLELFSPNAEKLSCVLDEEEPWDNYQKTVEKIIGEQDYQSQLGGYPKWVQGESTPENADGTPMKLLFQIDSEDNAGLMWGDVGLVYVFCDEATKIIELTLQCH